MLHIVKEKKSNFFFYLIKKQTPPSTKPIMKCFFFLKSSRLRKEGHKTELDTKPIDKELSRSKPNREFRRETKSVLVAVVGLP